MIQNQSIESEKWSQLADCLGVPEARHLTSLTSLASSLVTWSFHGVFVKETSLSGVTMHFNSPLPPASSDSRLSI